MTGFGKSEKSFETKNITVEIRSLNSKMLDLSIKLPGIYRLFEYDIRSIVAKALQRGKVDMIVSIATESESTAVTINRKVFSDYYGQMTEICKESGLASDDRYIAANLFGAILRMPDVVRSQEEEVGEEELATLNFCIAEAVESITAFRQREGEALIADIISRIGLIEKLNGEIASHENARTAMIRQKMEDGIAKLGLAIDQTRFAQEMIYYMERLDITEERVRLTNHCGYFRQVATTEDAPGRKLGFITQEMGREINTMGAKASSVEIQQFVVMMKDELEKVKEQLLNIL